MRKILISVLSFLMFITLLIPQSYALHTRETQVRAFTIEWLAISLGARALPWLREVFHLQSPTPLMPPPPPRLDPPDNQADPVVLETLNALTDDDLEILLEGAVNEQALRDLNTKAANDESSPDSDPTCTFPWNEILVAETQIRAGEIVLHLRTGARIQVTTAQFIKLFMKHRVSANLTETRWARYRVTALMIVQEFLNLRETIRFESLDDAFSEVYFRLWMVMRFKKIVNTSAYNQDSDTFQLPKDWSPIPAYFKKGGKGSKFAVEENCAFQPAPGVNPYDAISACYKTRKHPNLFDCSGAVLTHAYGSLAEALEARAFNHFIQNNPNALTISPLWAQFRFEESQSSSSNNRGNQAKKKTERRAHPVFTNDILKAIEIEHLTDLLPGAIVYFRNHPLYEELYPEGWWAGEWCIYLGIDANGQQIFAGLGAGPSSFKDMVQTLRDRFTADTGLDFPDLDDEDTDDIVDNSFPSIETRVFDILAFRKGGRLAGLRSRFTKKKF